MRLILAGICCVLLLISCSDRSEFPKGILSRKQMRDVTWDMARTGEFLSSFVFSRDSALDKKDVSNTWFQKIFQLHKVSEDEFVNSLKYYQLHPGLLKELLDSLAKRQAYAYQRPATQDIQTSAQQHSVPGGDSSRRADSIRRRNDSLRLRQDTLRKRLFKKIRPSRLPA